MGYIIGTIVWALDVFIVALEVSLTATSNLLISVSVLNPALASINTALTWVAQMLSYLSPFFPMDELANALTFYVLMQIAIFSFRVFWKYVFPFIPVVGESINSTFSPTYDYMGRQTGWKNTSINTQGGWTLRSFTKNKLDRQ